MKILDLFCGCGGFSCGFLSKENTFVGVDKWEVALETYKNNIPGETINTDILSFDPSTVGKIDILIGSPPCQDFSTANHRRTMDTKLVEKYLEIKNILNPKWWVMEEVPGVGKIGEEKGWFDAKYLQANWFGLPHERKRLFAGNYPRVMNTMYHTVDVLTPIAQIRGYGHSIQQREKLKIYYSKLAGVDDWKSKTFEEVVTVDLYRRVMGFPDTYKFSGKRKEQYQQIGNAVCPPVSRAIWQSIERPSKGGIFK